MEAGTSSVGVISALTSLMKRVVFYEPPKDHYILYCSGVPLDEMQLYHYHSQSISLKVLHLDFVYLIID